jgi:hypothetical protein
MRNAAQWARDKVGCDGDRFYCLRFVARAYGQQNAGRETAHELYTELVRSTNIHAYEKGRVPIGALVFWDFVPSKTVKVDGVILLEAGKNYGHVAIHVGGDIAVSAPITRDPNSPNKADRVFTKEIEKMSGVIGGNSKLLGWAYPPSEWLGRHTKTDDEAQEHGVGQAPQSTATSDWQQLLIQMKSTPAASVDDMRKFTEQEQARTLALGESAASTISSLSARGREAVRLRKYAGAIDAYERLLKIDGRNFEALTNLAGAYYELRELDNALQYAAKALQRIAAPGVFFIVASAYARKGERDEALAWLEKSLQGGFAETTMIRENFKRYESEAAYMSLLERYGLRAE